MIRHLYRGVKLGEGNKDGYGTPSLALMVDAIEEATRAKLYGIDSYDRGFDSDRVEFVWRKEVFSAEEAKTAARLVEELFHHVREISHSTRDSLSGNIVNLDSF